MPATSGGRGLVPGTQGDTGLFVFASIEFRPSLEMVTYPK